MALPEKIILAGAESVPGLAQMKNAFASIGIEASFAEAPFMLNYGNKKKDSNIVYEKSLPKNAIAIPLTEYWISYCARTGHCCISEKALHASRSKKYFSKLLTSLGLDAVHLYANREEAMAALESGACVMVKPESLCSGLGVLLVTPEKKEMLDEDIRQALAVKTKNMRLMELTNSEVMLTEYITGIEYSADCFYADGRVSIVRVCCKRIVVINNKPCAAVYQTVKPSELIEQKLYAWMNALFEKGNISFAQFDFIITSDEKRVVPIDFAARIGGGLFELMAMTGTNPYADAVRGECHLYDSGKTFSQYNYLSTLCGFLKSEDFNLAEGTRIVYKHFGDYVIGNPSSVGSRVAIVVRADDTDALPVAIEKSLLIDERWIIPTARKQQ